MKAKVKWILASVLSVATVSLAAVGCTFQSADTSEAPQGEAYEWTFDKPFAGEVDDYMEIDGKLDEDVWQDKNYLSNNYMTAFWQVTTHFSDKGIYIGLKAVDDTMVYKTRYTSRSAFYVYLCKTGTQTYHLDNLKYHEGRCFQFQCDPYYCRSMNRVPYYYAANVDGELNGEEICTMTAELFVTWEDLYYTQDELGENGYPEDIQMYVNYEGESSEVLGSCLWREETYLHYDKDGYKTLSKYEGNFAPDLDGFGSTDMWQKNEAGNYYTTAGRAQILWFNDSSSSDFAFEAKLKPLSTTDDGQAITFRNSTVSGRFGIINKTLLCDGTINTTSNKAVYSVYSADARSICDKASGQRQIKLQTCKQIDSAHWSNRFGLYETLVQSNYEEEYLTLRVIKRADRFYYFYGDSYWTSELNDSMQGEVYSGIFTSQGVEILECSFTDFSNNLDALDAELSKYVYFIEVPGVSTYGTVTTSSDAVSKGDSVTIKFVSGATGGVLTQIKMNGTDKYDEIVEAMNEQGEYTFVPTEDVKFEVEFRAFDADSLVKTVVKFYSDEGLVRDANYQIFGGEKLLYYSGTPNAAGYVILSLPKAGSYTIDGRRFTVSGEYTISATFSANHAYSGEFTLNDDTTSTDIYGKSESVAADNKYTYYAEVRPNAFGSVVVNSKTLQGTGALQYNDETGNYYATSKVNQYYKKMIGENFELTATLHLSNIGHSNNDLAAIQISNGQYLYVLKVNLSNSGSLMICTGAGTESTSEICVTGFGWSSKGSNYGAVTINVVKCGMSIYLYDANNTLRVRLDVNGVHLFNGASIVEWSKSALVYVNAVSKVFFQGKQDVAVGVKTYVSSSLRAEFDLDYRSELSESTKASIDYGTLKVTLAQDMSMNELYTAKDGYACGEIVKFAVNASKVGTGKVQAVVKTKDGTKVIDAVYDYENRCYIFSFVHEGGAIDVSAYVLSKDQMGWSSEWTEFEPNRDNTFVD